MTEIYTFYVCGNNGQHSFNIQNTAVLCLLYCGIS